jgi:hypothetical protein
MVRHKQIDTSPRFIVVDLERQLLPGTARLYRAASGDRGERDRAPCYVRLFAAFRSKRNHGNAYLAFKFPRLAITGSTLRVVLETWATIKLQPAGRQPVPK